MGIAINRDVFVAYRRSIDGHGASNTEYGTFMTKSIDL